MKDIFIDQKLLDSYMELKKLVFKNNLTEVEFRKNVNEKTELGQTIWGFFEQFGEKATSEMESFIKIVFHS